MQTKTASKKRNTANNCWSRFSYLHSTSVAVSPSEQRQNKERVHTTEHEFGCAHTRKVKHTAASLTKV